MANNVETVSFDALLDFALDETLRREAARLPSLEELRKKYPDLSGLERKLHTIAEEKYREEKRKKRHPLRVLKQIGIAAAILVSLLFGTLMANAEVRAVVVDTVIEWTERAIGIQFEVDGVTLTALPEGYEPHYIPEGFVYQEELSWKTDGDFVYSYQSEDGTSILDIQVGVAQNASGYFLDNEHIEHEKITFNGVAAYYGHGTSVGGDEISTLLWVKDGIEHYIYTNVTMSELFEIAENIY